MELEDRFDGSWIRGGGGIGLYIRSRVRQGRTYVTVPMCSNMFELSRWLSRSIAPVKSSGIYPVSSNRYKIPWPPPPSDLSAPPPLAAPPFAAPTPPVNTPNGAFSHHLALRPPLAVVVNSSPPPPSLSSIFLDLAQQPENTSLALCVGTLVEGREEEKREGTRAAAAQCRG